MGSSFSFVQKHIPEPRVAVTLPLALSKAVGKRLPWFSIWASVWFGERLKGQSQRGSGRLTQNGSQVRQSIATYRQHGPRPECPLHLVESGRHGVCYTSSEGHKPSDPGQGPALQPRPHWLGCEWTADKPGGACQMPSLPDRSCGLVPFACPYVS